MKTAPGIFQQVMNKMVTGLQGVATYLDDILVSGRNEQEHRENLFAVLGRISDVKKKNISRCQEYAKNPIKAPLEAWSTVAYAWQRIHVDFAGPVCGLFYMVVVDAFSKWPEIIEMTSISAAQTVRELKRIFARYGIPQTIVSDNGKQFTPEQFKMMCEEGGITHVRTAPYHPQ
uniref:Integrase catalytic domain-containing protein n=1 Tax=Haemonchus contortus TaxID=6289 RepID=A0A7I4Z1D3_HAECO